ncbi:MAG: hypothetical protein IPK16_27435 [Anaerolineales bacterium]|nr:hypothetical protein [Anaerolineales bacterium]
MIENLLLDSDNLAVLHSAVRSDPVFEWDEIEHGVFAYYLLEGMRDLATERKDTLLTVTEVHHDVSAKLDLWARRQQVALRPILEFKGRGDLVLASIDSTGQVPEAAHPGEPVVASDMQYASAEALLAAVRGGQRSFVGREKELQRVLKLIQDTPTPNLASLIIGGPGIGKTSF